MKPHLELGENGGFARTMRRVGAAAIVGLAGLAAATTLSGASEQSAGAPRLETNQAYVETVTRKTGLDADDPMSVFRFILGSLPGEVTVYPTENYYYFAFTHRGHEYVGNLRFDIADRDQGVVHFAYFEKYTEWRRGEDPIYKLLGKDDGVAVKKLSKLSYSVTHAGKTVRFNMVDLSGVRPPKEALGKDEQYIGPVFDESGIQFYLVFNRALKVFHYVLNEAVPVGETLFDSEVSKDIKIGLRTGFAYYVDPFVKRKILIGVHASNSRVNNYYDGPFDQLPDNFIEGNVLHDAIVAADPEMKGKIDRLGNSPDGATRYFIGPYMHYEDEGQLAAVSECMADPRVTRADYALCLVIDQNEEEGGYGEGPSPEGETTDDGEKAAPDTPSTEKPKKTGARASK